MPQYVAFLRAINIGGRTVKMDELRTQFRSAGFTDVETFIASGNVIFTTPSKDAAKIESRISSALGKGLGYPVVAFVRSIPEVHEIAARQPFTDLERPGIRTVIYIILCGAPPAAAFKKDLATFKTDTDEFAVEGREIFWLHRGPSLEWPLARTKHERTATEGTMRNRNTLVRLAAKYPL
jgi:uncharacterized protein (DUF1697 family)